ncbi:reverse transcriptase domain-containing protein [Chrysosporum ovalisporum ANA283AFssAo]|uniref:reverse transcriptase domain-containing protein n=1 Tax=Umezakia ovalisporum TaxID=75695 RepID=UPI002473F3F1|nr:reverse transcriptase domain-containing protein [Umezakia ovalisporum]MDH6102789.1 reverse transcriptase domain-containing protein [Umezakia ovalisporum ANA283AFssAo]
MKTTKTSFKTTVVWNNINWNKIQRMVLKLQKRIHKAAQRGDVKAMRRLQKTLMKSWYAKLLATRTITQNNKGKNTVEVDKVKSLGYAQRLELAKNLGTNRIIWIPKPGTHEKQPLGIAPLANRANQALAKLALEPEWEAKFEPNSYGFRPGRAAHDAIKAIYLAIQCQAKYVLNADISKCFDNIEHQKVLSKLNTYPSMRRLIRKWLRSGLMDKGDIFPTETGTPQQGVISPLLANIALHGMEEVIKEYANAPPTPRNYGRKQNHNTLSLIRYAGGFVIIHKDVNVVLRAKAIIAGFLKDIGLELKPSRTRICHTLEEYEGEKPGFDFLGFNIRQFPVNDGMSARSTRGKILGFQTIIQPSKKAVQSHYKVISDVIDSHKAAPQKALIQKLNPIIEKWANYYSSASSTQAFKDISRMIYVKLRSWARYRHPNQGTKWVLEKYWTTLGGDNWVFGYINPDTNERYILSKHTWTQIFHHIKVKDETSLYHGEFVYWGARTGQSKEISSLPIKNLYGHKGKSAGCGLTLTTANQATISLNRTKFAHLQTLHRHCHKKIATDGSLSSSRDKGMFSEEPDEMKVSCPVLETSITRESVA